MTDGTRPLAELLAKAGDGDLLRCVAEALVQLLTETDVEGLIGAGRHERTGDRTTHRSGHRDRALGTRLGSKQLVDPPCGSTPSCVRAAPCRRSWSLAGRRTGSWWR